MIVSKFRILFFAQTAVFVSLYVAMLTMLWIKFPILFSFDVVPIGYILMIPGMGIPFIILDWNKITLNEKEIVIENLVTRRKQIISFYEIKIVRIKMHRIQMKARTTDPYPILFLKTKEGKTLSISSNTYENFEKLKTNIYRLIKENKLSGNKR